MTLHLPFWQRLVITIAAVILASGLLGLAWQAMFNFSLPAYLAGLVGGLAALPIWDLLKRIRPSQR
jgi:glucose-6-phosphate-specific signal transduction histidine kinase